MKNTYEGFCNHPICFVCSSQMRVICNKYYCPICRANLKEIVFVSKDLASIDYAQIDSTSFILQDKHGILFEKKEIKDKFDMILSNRCKLCSTEFSQFDDLDSHMKVIHKLYYCAICVSNLSLFSSQRKTYSERDLERHRKFGDPDDNSHKGHPLCSFCKLRFMDDDVLYTHLRKSHFFCHFCDAEDLKVNFFPSYDFLKYHFRENHYLCEIGICKEEKFVCAFKTDLDYRAHILEKHNETLDRIKKQKIKTISYDMLSQATSSKHNATAREASVERDLEEKLRVLKPPSFNEDQFPSLNIPLSSTSTSTTSTSENKSEVAKIDFDLMNEKAHCKMSKTFNHISSFPSTLSSIISSPEVCLNNDYSLAKKINLVKDCPNFRNKKSFLQEFPFLSNSSKTTSANTKVLIPPKNVSISELFHDRNKVNKKEVNNSKNISATPIRRNDFPPLGLSEGSQKKSFIPCISSTENIKKKGYNGVYFQPTTSNINSSISKETNKMLECSFIPDLDVKIKKKRKGIVQASFEALSSSNASISKIKYVKGVEDNENKVSSLNKTVFLTQLDFPSLQKENDYRGFVKTKESLKKKSNFSKNNKDPVNLNNGTRIKLDKESRQLSTAKDSVGKESIEYLQPNLLIFQNVKNYYKNNAIDFSEIYVYPKNFKLRNESLSAALQVYLENPPSLYDAFCESTSKYIHLSSIKASEFINRIHSFLGSEAFNLIFPEMLILISNIIKQHELLATYIKQFSLEGLKSELLICPQCFQVISPFDKRMHTQYHLL